MIDNISPRALDAALLAHGLPTSESLAQLLDAEPELYAAVMATAERLERIAAEDKQETESSPVSLPGELSVTLSIPTWLIVLRALRAGHSIRYHKNRAARRAARLPPDGRNLDLGAAAALEAADAAIARAVGDRQ